MSMIANTRKSLSVDFTMSEIKSALNGIPKAFNNKYTLHARNEIFNQYTFSASEALSAGAYIDINLNAISENRTEISIEVRRKIGSFNSSVEVMNANTHITNIYNGLAKLLENVRRGSMKIDVSNPVKTFEFKFSWIEARKRIAMLIPGYSNMYGIKSNSNELIELIRHPMSADKFVIEIDALLKIKPESSSENKCIISFEATNEKGKIQTASELQRNELIIENTAQYISNILEVYKDKLGRQARQLQYAKEKLSSLKRWKLFRSQEMRNWQIAQQEKEVTKIQSTVSSIEKILSLAI